MFQTSPKIKSLAPIRILLFLYVLCAVVAIGCGKKSDLGYKSSESPAMAGVKSTDSKTTANQTEPNLTAEKVLQEPETKPVRLFLGDRYSGATGEVQEVTDEQLHKNFTLLLLSLEPDIRARELMKYLRNVFTEEQKAQALEIALAEDHVFLKLRQRRAEILENAFDGQNIDQELHKIEVETVKVAGKIRVKVHNIVLTQEQRDDLIAKRNAGR
jgi:hypothetical protein